MDLKLENGSTIENCKKVKTINDISKNSRLFFELGYYPSVRCKYIEENWIKTGTYKEIKNVEIFLKEDKYLNDFDYINHHNFYISN